MQHAQVQRRYKEPLRALVTWPCWASWDFVRRKFLVKFHCGSSQEIADSWSAFLGWHIFAQNLLKESVFERLRGKEVVRSLGTSVSARASCKPYRLSKREQWSFQCSFVGCQERLLLFSEGVSTFFSHLKLLSLLLASEASDVGRGALLRCFWTFSVESSNQVDQMKLVKVEDGTMLARDQGAS